MPLAPISRKQAINQWPLYVFVLPAALLVAIFCYYPSVSAIYHSFFEWSGGDAKRFIGLDNYRRVATDPVLWASFGTIAILVVANVFKLIPSIFLAVMIHRLKNDNFQYWYRVLLVVPMIVPSLVTLFIWKFFFDANFGVLNRILDATGIKSALVYLDGIFHWGVFHANAPIAWLSQPELIIPALILWGFPWIGTVGVLIYLAGLQSINSEIYEAADLDGVNGFQKFTHIELPLILTQVRLTLVLLIIGTLQGFGLQLLLLGENGGSAGRGMVPGLWMFNRAFIAGEFGYACAIGMTLFVFILLLTYINNKYVRTSK